MTLAYALGGAAVALGQHWVDQGEEKKRMAEQRRREAREDRLRGEDRAYREQWRDEDREYQNNKDAARASADTNVYRSLFGTESGGNFGAQNPEGYTGRSQFGAARLKDFSTALGIGPISMEKFKSDPELQKKAEEWHFKDINSFIDKNDLTRFEGQTIGGVEITRSGIIAMAHLGGSNGAKRFLESGGKYNPADSNKTSLSDYARTHGGLDTKMDGIWDTLSDPNVSPALRDKAATEIARRRGLGPKTAKLTGEEWVPKDGKETLMGRDDKGVMRPYTTQDGKPITRDPKDTSKPRQLSNNMSERIDTWAADNVVDDAVKRKFKIKTEEFMRDGMTENAAWDATLGVAEKSADQVTVKDGWFKDTEEVKEGTYTGRFTDELKPRGLGPAPSAQNTPTPPSDPASNNPGSPAAPQIGEVIEGYEFMGGDPGDEKNWRKV